jgi:Outer membrane protein beta-barrel domain
MHATHFWYQFALHRHKVTFILLLCALPFASQGQIFKWASQHNPHYDDKKLTYGFMIGLHTSSYQVNYSNQFVTPSLDTVQSVVGTFLPGFSLGFLVNLRLTEYLDFRVMPKAGFYDHQLTYYYTDGTTSKQFVETTVVEFPLLFKYKSSRRGNVRMYMIGGITPGIEASGKNDVQSNTANLSINKGNLSLDGGLGFDFYFPLFKFSQEIRFSRGLVNMLGSAPSAYHAPINRLNTNTISVYFIFQ